MSLSRPLTLCSLALQYQLAASAVSSSSNDYFNQHLICVTVTQATSFIWTLSHQYSLYTFIHRDNEPNVSWSFQNPSCLSINQYHTHATPLRHLIFKKNHKVMLLRNIQAPRMNDINKVVLEQGLLNHKLGKTLSSAFRFTVHDHQCLHKCSPLWYWWESIEHYIHTHLSKAAQPFHFDDHEV